MIFTTCLISLTMGNGQEDFPSPPDPKGIPPVEVTAVHFAVEEQHAEKSAKKLFERCHCEEQSDEESLCRNEYPTEILRCAQNDNHTFVSFQTVSKAIITVSKAIIKENIKEKIMREPTTDTHTGFQVDNVHFEMNLQERPGCLSGLLKLLALGAVYNWLQENFGFGRGCLGTGCGIIFFVVAAIFFCSIIFGTNWFDFGF